MEAQLADSFGNTLEPLQGTRESDLFPTTSQRRHVLLRTRTMSMCHYMPTVSVPLPPQSQSLSSSARCADSAGTDGRGGRVR